MDQYDSAEDLEILHRLRLIYIAAWKAYYRASEEIDGGILFPTTPAQRMLVKRAAGTGNVALYAVLANYGVARPPQHDPTWINCRSRALLLHESQLPQPCLLYT